MQPLKPTKLNPASNIDYKELQKTLIHFQRAQLELEKTRQGSPLKSVSPMREMINFKPSKMQDLQNSTKKQTKIEKAFKILDEKNKGSKISLLELKKKIPAINPNFPKSEYKALTQGKPELKSKDLYELLKQNELQDFDPLEQAFSLLDPKGEGLQCSGLWQNRQEGSGNPLGMPGCGQRWQNWAAGSEGDIRIRKTQTMIIINILKTMDEVLSQISNQVYEFDTLGLVQQYIFELSEHFKENHNAQVDIQQFVMFFINKTDEQGIEGLILISKLIELYQEILHITDYLISTQEICSEYFNAKFLPSQNNKNQLTRRNLTDIEISPPEILGLNPSMLRRLQTQLKIEIIHINNQIINGIKGDNDLFLILQFCESVCMLHEFQFKKMLQPRNMIDGNFVVYGYYSTRQQRLGVVLRNNTLIFWDKRDNYTYDYQIETQLELSHIAYIEMQDQWITSTSKSLQIWNLEQGKHQNLQNQVFSGGIIQLLEVIHLQMLIVASNPNIISCWDMFEQKFLFKFQVSHQILYQVVCSRQFQLIFTIGFNNYISCYELHAQYNDYNLKCQLVGHSSTVQCIEHIEQTALLISIDTKNVVILWDIRSQQQTQTVNLQTRILTRQLMFYSNKLCLVANMLQTLSFEKELHLNKQIKLLQVIYDQWNKRNIIITKADIRIQDIITGKIQYILSDFQNEISASCLIEHGFHQNMVKSCNNGNHFSEEIISIQYDEAYKILHIASIQGILKCLPLTQLNVCKDNILKDKWAIRQLSVNICINICQLSIVQGLLAISYEDFIQIWNLEYYCVSIQIQLEDSATVTSMVFCDSLPLLIIGTNQADIFIFQLVQKNDKLQCTLEGHLNIVKAVLIQKLKSVYPDRISIMSNLFSKTSTELNELYDEGDEQIEVKHLFNNKYKLMTHGSFASRLLIQLHEEELRLYIATNRGSALVFNITQLLEKKTVTKKLEQISQRPNYNPYRVVYNDLQGNFIDNYQIVQNRLIKDQVKKREYKFEQSSKIKQKFRNSLIRFSILKGLKDNPELDITHTLKDSIFHLMSNWRLQIKFTMT